MVIKGRFFLSSKKSDSSSSQDGSNNNSPRSVNSDSPTRSKSKSKSALSSSVSPILASSLGLNRIKTRSGPLPQESFLGFRGGADKLGSSNLSKKEDVPRLLQNSGESSSSGEASMA